jgi:hypothetical protein
MNIVLIEKLKEFKGFFHDIEWSAGFIFGGLPVLILFLPLFIAGWLFQIKDDPIALFFGIICALMILVSSWGAISSITAFGLLLAVRALIYLIEWLMDLNESRWIKKTASKIENGCS